MYRGYPKRLLDFFVAFFILVLLFPVFMVTFIALLVVNDWKPFFFQTRPGKNEKPFRIIKFRTMNDKKDLNGNFLPDEQRLTYIGAFLRKTSLDEIPQFLNVLQGDMSLIGPRPLLPQYLPFYNEVQKRRHEVRPGITGLAQVSGRNSISWTKKFELDVWYVNNISLILDFKIFLLTIQKVILREGISQEGQVTTEDFNGDN